MRSISHGLAYVLSTNRRGSRGWSKMYVYRVQLIFIKLYISCDYNIANNDLKIKTIQK